MKTRKRYSPEVRERAVRIVLEQQNEHASQWAAIQSISSKIGCPHETLRRWVRQAEVDQGIRGGMIHTKGSPEYPGRFRCVNDWFGANPSKE